MNRLRMYFAGVLFSLVFSPILPAGELLPEIDALYAKGGLENLGKTVGLCADALKQNPESHEANWKCARSVRKYADMARKNEVEGWKTICKTNGKAAMAYAQKAIRIDPDKPDGYYYYGLGVGVYSDGVGILTAIKEGLKDKTSENLEKAYELDKLYDNGGATLALGRFWAVLPWPFTDKKKALKYYREYQQTEFFDHYPEGMYYLAELLEKLGGKKNKSEAKTVLERVIQLDDPYYKGLAETLLKEID